MNRESDHPRTEGHEPGGRPQHAIHHALGLHMHQPPGNLRLLIDDNEWEAQQIIRCYERVARYARQFADVARIHVGFSGVLLEQLRSPDIIDRYRRFVDIPAMLASYREATNIEPIGMGFYHPVFPLIPREDWGDQLDAGRQIATEVFGRAPRGFWPSEMGFDMSMIPALRRAEYEYVVVDSVHVQATSGDGAADLYRPRVAEIDGASIVVIPRDRDVSNAQESGMDDGWFVGEVSRRVSGAAGVVEPRRLITTWSDGENGGWFRNMNDASNFFGHFYAPLLERVRAGTCAIRPVLLSDYVDAHPASGSVHVQTGAWNVAETSGYDFTQWAGSDAQRRAIESVFAVSGHYHRLAAQQLPADAGPLLGEARRLVLESETSCFLFWGDSWIPKLYERTEPAERLLRRVEDAVSAKRHA